MVQRTRQKKTNKKSKNWDKEPIVEDKVIKVDREYIKTKLDEEYVDLLLNMLSNYGYEKEDLKAIVYKLLGHSATIQNGSNYLLKIAEQFKNLKFFTKMSFSNIFNTKKQYVTKNKHALHVALSLAGLSFYIRFSNYKFDQTNPKHKKIIEAAKVYTYILSELGLKKTAFLVSNIAIQDKTNKDVFLKLRENINTLLKIEEDVKSKLRQNNEIISISGRVKNLLSAENKYRKYSNEKSSETKIYEIRKDTSLIELNREVYDTLGVRVVINDMKNIVNIVDPLLKSEYQLLQIRDYGEFIDNNTLNCFYKNNKNVQIGYINKEKKYKAVHLIFKSLKHNVVFELQVRQFKDHMDAEYFDVNHTQYKTDKHNNNEIFLSAMKRINELLTILSDYDVYKMINIEFLIIDKDNFHRFQATLSDLRSKNYIQKYKEINELLKNFEEQLKYFIYTAMLKDLTPFILINKKLITDIKKLKDGLGFYTLSSYELEDFINQKLNKL